MDAIVICGGQGTRVREITKDEIPKILIKVNRKPFIEHLINTLYSQGVRRIVFAAGFKGEKINEYLERRHFDSSCIPWPRMSVEIETEPLDTGGAVLNILNKSGYGIHSDPFLVVNGDSLIIPEPGTDNYEELYYEDVYGKPSCAMFTCRVDNDGRYGSLSIDTDGWIESFRNKQSGRSWINCGWYIMRHEFFAHYRNPICNRDKIQIYDVERVSLERELFPNHVEQGEVIKPIVIGPKQFIEIGTPEALEEAARRLHEK
jgi:NDP-sugar pyrophosphorylase family protein